LIKTDKMGSNGSKGVSNNSNGPQLGPAWSQNSFWPKPDDSVEVLEQKKKLNTNAAWGEIGADLVVPSRESDVTEFQSNALVAQEYINQKADK